MENETDNSTHQLDDSVWLITLRFVVIGVGIVLNTVVTGVFLYIRMYKKSLVHGLIVQQSFLDLFGCCTFLFFYNQDAPDGEIGTVFCKGRMLFWFFAVTSTYNLVVITIERYLSIMYPFKFKDKPILIVCIIYITPHVIGALIVFHLAILADINEDKSGECLYNYPNNKVRFASGICIFLTLFFIPTCIMICCKGRAIWEIRSSDNWRQSHSTSDASMYKNLAYTMCFVVIVFICTSSPNFTLYLVYIICQCFEFSTIVEHEITVLLYTSNMCINPIVYGAKMKDFRRGLDKIRCKLRGLLRRDVGGRSHNVSVTSHSSNGIVNNSYV
ncbi:sphingosine 1-phosphate receptor 3-like [Antedon mediterranea]|uniref:sphingosine 1-phosphate receptor 3-like n=1 Tax=Antedon mediterranea TaxID=105859 RepID=UPI003AF63135